MALAGYSMPVFWLGQIMLLVFSLHLAWFPTQGMRSARADGGLGRPRCGASSGAAGHHLRIFHLALVFRLTRVKMQDVIALDFITTARAKGASASRGLRHALRNAMLPVMTVIGLNFGFMLAGSVLTENVFAWPGMGRLLFEAIEARDYPVLMGLFLFLSVMVILANVLTDMVYALIDPRVVYDERRQPHGPAARLLLRIPAAADLRRRHGLPPGPRLRCSARRSHPSIRPHWRPAGASSRRALPHLMGTDDLGRDVFSRALRREDLDRLGLVAASMSTALGLLVGGRRLLRRPGRRSADAHHRGLPGHPALLPRHPAGRALRREPRSTSSWPSPS